MYQMMYTWIAVIVAHLYTAESLGCFECTSINGSVPDCEDTFSNTGKHYKADCLAGRKNRAGLFLGTECLKVTAQHQVDKNYTVVVRKCVVDNGGTNFETEIGRVDHCGLVNELLVESDGGNVRMSGCVATCRTDGCNATWRVTAQSWLSGLTVMMSMATVILNDYC